MKVCVLGLWHLGAVTAACLASAGHQVVGLDFEPDVIQQLQTGQPPIFEPGLEELIKRGLAENRLSFTANSVEALAETEVVWVAYDTPVDDQDQADVEFVVERISRVFPHLAAGSLVLISSQVPVGTTQRLDQMYATAYPHKPITFAYSPENLRLGQAISVFTQPDRVVVGRRTEADHRRIALLLKPFTERIEWMSVESAEMTKHALNAFLATSVTFINEIATLCEQVGADAKEVERGLKSEARIGPKAYLGPGAAFAGGTLARDIAFLNQIGATYDQPTHLLSAVQTSNDYHKQWLHRKLLAFVTTKAPFVTTKGPFVTTKGPLLDNPDTGGLRGQTVAVWGLTYKPGTDTLRRSSSVELCEWLADQGARVQAHDPAIKALPAELAQKFTLCSTPPAALAGASALVIATAWPDYRSIEAEAVVSAIPSPIVVDPNRFLVDTLGSDPRIQYITIGKGTV